jgi:hypothetical protein
MSDSSNKYVGSILEDIEDIKPDDKDTSSSRRTFRQMPPGVYNTLLAYLNAKAPVFRDYRNLPHPMGASILPPTAASLTYFKHNARDFSVYNAHPGNSALAFQTDDGTTGTGLIDTVWSLTMDGSKRTFVVINPHETLSSQDNRKSPYRHHPGLLTKLVYTSSSLQSIIIEPSHIISHIAYRPRPSKTFRILRATTIVHILDRGLSKIRYDFSG